MKKTQTQPTVENLLCKKKYDLAYKVAKNENRVEELLKLMTTNHHCNHVNFILNAEDKSFADYPLLEERIMKKYVRYLQKSFKWEQIELRILASKQLLAYFCEDLFYNHGKYDEQLRDIALSIVQRYSLESVVQKIELKSEIGQPFTYIPNVYIQNDDFGKLISAKRIDIQQGQTVFILEWVWGEVRRSDFGW